MRAVQKGTWSLTTPLEWLKLLCSARYVLIQRPPILLRAKGVPINSSSEAVEESRGMHILGMYYLI